MLRIFLIYCLIAVIICLFISLILCKPILAEVKDLRNEKFHIKRRSRLDLDNYDSVKNYVGVFLSLPLTVLFSFVLRDFITLSDSTFSNMSQTIAALTLSMFGLILFMDFFKEKNFNQRNNIENYLKNHGYHTRISIMKYFVTFFLINFGLVNVDIGIPNTIIKICKIEVIILFILYVAYYFLGCLKLLLNYRKFENDKYTEIYNILSNNYMNRPKQNIYVEDEKDVDQLITTFADKFNKLIMKHKFRNCKKIEYVKCEQFKHYFKEKPGKLFICSMRLFITIYTVYYLLFSSLILVVYFNILIILLAGLLILCIYLTIAHLIFKYDILKDFDKVNVFTRMIIARNRDYNKFVIHKGSEIRVEENVELWKDDYSKLCVLYFASTLNAFEQILYNDFNKERSKNYMKFNVGILEIIESYCKEIVSVDSDFSKMERRNFSVPCYSIICILETCVLPSENQAQENELIKSLNKSKKIILKNKKSLEKKFEEWGGNSVEVAESIISATLAFSNKEMKTKIWRAK